MHFCARLFLFRCAINDSLTIIIIIIIIIIIFNRNLVNKQHSLTDRNLIKIIKTNKKNIILTHFHWQKTMTATILLLKEDERVESNGYG